MVTAEQMRAEAQPKLRLIVEGLVRDGHSTMGAYKVLARQLGRRPAWVQRVIGRRDQVVVAAHDWLNITTICARLDAASERIEAAAGRIRGDHDAGGEPSPIFGAARASDRPAGHGADREVAP